MRSWIGSARLGCCTLLVLSACGESGCGEPEAKTTIAPSLVRAHTAVASREDVLELSGTVTAARRVRLGFKHGGPIAAIAVEEGQQVVRGQLLGRLDRADAMAAVRAARAGHDKARRDADRAAHLAKGGAIPLHARDDSGTQLEAAEATLLQAREALDRTRLISPVAGTVFARLAEPGETVGPGMPVLVIDSSGRLAVRAGASQAQLERLRPEQRCDLVLEDGRTTTGRVESLARTPRTGSTPSG